MYLDHGGLLQNAIEHYHEDPFFRKILDTPTLLKNFEVLSNGLLHLILYAQTTLYVPDIKIEEQWLQEMVIDQAHSLLAHLGARKTTFYLWEHVLWEHIA